MIKTFRIFSLFDCSTAALQHVMILCFEFRISIFIHKYRNLFPSFSRDIPHQRIFSEGGRDDTWDHPGLPGAPVISRIGDALFTSGPFITELSIKVGVEGIETVYNFNSQVKKAGRTNSDVVKQIRKISGRITGK